MAGLKEGCSRPVCTPQLLHAHQKRSACSGGPQGRLSPLHGLTCGWCGCASRRKWESGVFVKMQVSIRSAGPFASGKKAATAHSRGASSAGVGVLEKGRSF